MTRITNATLTSRMMTVNMILERPVEMFAFATGVVYNVGHISIDHNQQGYQLEEIVGKTGGTNALSARLSAFEMSVMIDGLIQGIALRNGHIGQMLMKGELAKVGFTDDHKLYSDELLEAARKVFKEIV